MTDGVLSRIHIRLVQKTFGLVRREVSGVENKGIPITVLHFFCSHYREVASRQSTVEKYPTSCVPLITASSFSLVTAVDLEWRRNASGLYSIYCGVIALLFVYEKRIRFELFIAVLVIDNIVTYLVTRHGVWISNRIYCTPKTRNCK
jgi:hypothetical protein